MPDERYSHFAIPPEIVRSTRIKVRGRAKPFSRPDYSAHGDFLRERTAAIKTYGAETADADASESLFLRVRTPDSLPIRGERQRLKSAGMKLVSLSPIDPSSATVQMRKADIGRLERRVARYALSEEHPGKSYLSIIEDLAPVPAEEKLSPELTVAEDEPVDCMLLFYSSLTERERAAVLLAVRSFLARIGSGVGQMRRFSNGVTAVAARIRPSEARRAGAAFSTLRHIAPDHVFFVPDAWRISSLPSQITVVPPRLTSAVAVVDTGINPSCRGLAGCVAAVIPFLPAGAVTPEFNHGTFVGSRVAYGDDLEQGLQRGTLAPACPIIDVPVIGIGSNGVMTKVDELHLAAAVDDVLPRLPKIARVVNLSLGNRVPTSDGQVSIVAQLLDKHAREQGLVVVTTAGNIDDPRVLRNFPNGLVAEECRIDSPGDALLALTIGSFARFTDGNALSKSRELSAFSRRGPGPFGGIKPDLVAHGGNCFPDGTTTARIGTHGLMGRSDGWASDYGTSFAAPLVSRIGAELMDHYQGPPANLVRALLLHFTKPVVTPSIAIAAHHLIGLGEPDSTAAMWSKDDAAAFLYHGELVASNFTFVPFFVPACLAPGLAGRLRIRATVVIDPPVDPDNHMAYSKARVSLAFRKPADVGHTEIGVADDAVDVDKWSPVEQIDKVFHRSYATGRWELRLRLWTRDLDPEFKQAFAVVIEVIDDTGSAPVRSAIETEGGSVFRHVAVRAAA